MMWENLLTQFHFLRPEWFWALIPSALFFALLWRLQQQNSNWMTTISAELLPHLLDEGSQQKRHHIVIIILFAWLITIIALAGPTWSKLPQPVHQREDALVIIMDLSLSLYATDLKPSRLIYAQRKLTDILHSRKEGQTALIVYSGDAHVVSPLTDDTATIIAMVPALAPNIMPSYGSNAIAGAETALKLMKDAGVAHARILLITDELLEKDLKPVASLFAGDNTDLAILGIGTKDGAPIPTREGGFLKDNNGGIVVAQLNTGTLQSLANKTGGRYILSSISDQDIKFLLPDTVFKGNTRQIEREFDIWQEQGHWLVLLLLPIMLLSFRRGWLLSLFFAFSIVPDRAEAFEWQDLWQNKNQRGEKAFNKGDHQQAAELFKSQDWRASAQYRAGDYQAAAQSYGLNDSAQSNYNRGNALAKAGQIDPAIKAYERALELDPQMSDAIENKALLEQMKQEQESQDQDQQQNEDSEQSSQDEQNQSQQNSDQSKEKSEDQSSQEQQSDQNQQSQSDEQQNSEQDSEQQAQQSEDEKRQQQENQDKDPTDAESEQQSQAQQSEQEPLDTEQQQALEQWLRRVPDDPGGLLRRKFDYQYRQNMQKNGTSNNSGQQIW